MCVCGGGGAPILFKLGPNEKCVKSLQVRRRVEDVHHIPHIWVNSCRKEGFSRVGWVSQPKNWTNSYRGVGLGASPKPGSIF